PGAGEKPIFLAQTDRPDGAFGGIVVDGDAAIIEKKAERVPAAESIAKCLGQIPLGRNPGELHLGPGMQSLEPGPAQLLSYGTPNIGGLARDVALNVVELSDPLERFVSDRRSL